MFLYQLILASIFPIVDSQVLAAVIKAGASREHEILAEIRDSVFSFIRKMEPRRVMDTMLVSRVRILYIRSLLARSPELQTIRVSIGIRVVSDFYFSFGLSLYDYVISPGKINPILLI